VIKKTLATAAIAVSVVGAAGMATPAMAIGGDDEGGTSVNGNGTKQIYGNTTTSGYMSPNIALINGSFNRFCIGLDDLDLAVPAPLAINDVLNNKPKNVCSDNSTSVSGDSPLSHILSDLSLLSENGVSRH
jgi:hypothetical protein